MATHPAQMPVIAGPVPYRTARGRPGRHRAWPVGASADGRPPVANTANVRAEGVRQIRALDRGDHTGVAMPEAPVDHEPVGSLEAAELTILTCWAEAAAETLAASPDQLSTILDDARAGAAWRRQFGVGEPSADLASALEDLARIVASGTRLPGRCWPQRMSVQAAASTATWCEPSFARRSAGAGRVAEMAPSVRGWS